MPAKLSPVIFDVRSPGEYAHAHVPGAFSLPLFSDEERAKVGTTYTKTSREEAIKEGLTYVGPKLQTFIEEVEKKVGKPTEAPPLTLYCARGGMRSSSMAWLLGLYGYHVSTIPGGFKAYKHRLEPLVEKLTLVVLLGPTGAGKTDLLELLRERGEQVLDLEGLARHRGSAFGYLPGVTQPSDEMLRCLVIDALEGLDLSRTVFTESESLKIGRVSLPEELFQKMSVSDYLIVDTPRSLRAKRIVNLYGSLDIDFLKVSFEKIEKRIGGTNKQIALEALEKGDLLTATEIALDYYDKAYSRSSAQLFRGKEIGKVMVEEGHLDRAAEEIIRMGKR